MKVFISDIKKATGVAANVCSSPCFTQREPRSSRFRESSLPLHTNHRVSPTQPCRHSWNTLYFFIHTRKSEQGGGVRWGHPNPHLVQSDNASYSLKNLQGIPWMAELSSEGPPMVCGREEAAYTEPGRLLLSLYVVPATTVIYSITSSPGDITYAYLQEVRLAQCKYAKNMISRVQL